MVYIDKNKKAGWDDLYENYFEDINKLIEDNLSLRHNIELIEGLFSKMLKVLDKAEKRMQEFKSDENEKKGWYIKLKNIRDYAKEADTSNKKVITITIIDQFLRATY